MDVRVGAFFGETVAASPANRLPELFGGGPIFDRPLLGAARGDDPIFEKFKDVACPAGAISTSGHDKLRCMTYGRRITDEMTQRPLKALLKPVERVVDGKPGIGYPIGCALCQFGVPCTRRNPGGAT